MEALQIKINKWTISDDTLVVGGLEDNEVRGTREGESCKALLGNTS